MHSHAVVAPLVTPHCLSCRACSYGLWSGWDFPCNIIGLMAAQSRFALEQVALETAQGRAIILQSSVFIYGAA